MVKKFWLIILLLSNIYFSFAQNDVSKVWIADNSNGTYKNPVIHADYSDPDVIRVGDDYYMTASSFDAVPGLPILHSKDLVNWKISMHCCASLHSIISLKHSMAMVFGLPLSGIIKMSFTFIILILILEYT